jgi:hypothetical protein
MPSLTDGAGAALALNPSAANSSPTSPPNKSAYLAAEKMAKLKVAEYASLLQDSRRLLDTTAKDNIANRERQQRLSEAQTQQVISNLGANVGASANDPTTPVTTPTATDDMGGISIDSPVTITHNYPAPTPTATPTAPAPSPATPTAPLSTLAKVAIAAGTVLGTGGIGTGLYALLKPSAAPTTQVAPSTSPAFDPTKWQIKLVP